MSSVHNGARAPAHPRLAHPRSLVSLALGLSALVLTAGCAAPGKPALVIDKTHQARAQSSRVQYIVVHYTAAPLARSLNLLTTHKVSAHYLITDEPQPRIMQLVDESQSAWHAGQSSWYGRTWLNANAIGIEIVNAGYQSRQHGQALWAPYTPGQIDLTIALIKQIALRHNIAPENIVGHSDIAPQRKVDPGPLFPWERLAQAGLGRWFDVERKDGALAELARTGTPPIAWFQQQLGVRGYAVAQHGMLDDATRNVIAAFQMHYRPARYDGQPDAETAAILMALPRDGASPRISGEHRSADAGDP